MMTVDEVDIQAMEQRFRVNFINSLSGFKSANLVATASTGGVTNAAIVSSVIHLGASPALMGYITRPRSVERHTVENIQATGSYTLNHVGSDIIDQAHQTSARYLREQSEFTQVGLTEEYWQGASAPAVKESPLSIWMKLREIKTLDINDTQLVIGEIQRVTVRDAAVLEDGFIDLNRLSTVAVSGLDCYHQPKALKRLSYAKPDKPLTQLETNKK